MCDGSKKIYDRSAYICYCLETNLFPLMKNLSFSKSLFTPILWELPISNSILLFVMAISLSVEVTDIPFKLLSISQQL